jgi:hypothetical protein
MRFCAQGQGTGTDGTINQIVGKAEEAVELAGKVGPSANATNELLDNAAALE